MSNRFEIILIRIFLQISFVLIPSKCISFKFPLFCKTSLLSFQNEIFCKVEALTKSSYLERKEGLLHNFIYRAMTFALGILYAALWYIPICVYYDRRRI